MPGIGSREDKYAWNWCLWEKECPDISGLWKEKCPDVDGQWE